MAMNSGTVLAETDGLSSMTNGARMTAATGAMSRMKLKLSLSYSVRALAVTTTTRSEALPDVPTLNDFLPGYEASFWGGFGAPKNTPAEIVDKLNREINAALVDPNVKARLADLGGTVRPGSPADFGKLIAAETEKWGKVIRAANVKPD
jgi:tripartite-type tricarboxylate transporter receptor subunit TctC